MNETKLESILRKKYEEMVARSTPEELKKSVVVMGEKDCFGDSVPAKCDCGAEGFLRPWLARLAYKHEMMLMCVQCAKKKYPIKFTETLLEGAKACINEAE